MCGISAILSKTNDENIPKMTVSALKQLQNRGYDSMGIGLIHKKEIVVRRTISQNDIDTALVAPDSKGCIGHTRWATHGARTLNNAHPHTSANGLFCLVHNGIIENHASLRRYLTEIHGASMFKSETDSEVIVNLLEHYYKNDGDGNDGNDVIETIYQVCRKLSGTYGLAILCRDTPDTIYLIRNGSPILVGENDNYVMAASEMAGFDGQLTHFSMIPADCLTIIRANGKHIDVLDSDEKSVVHYCSKNEIMTPEPYPHWMLKEIIEQPTTLMQSINNGARIYGNVITLGGLHILKDIMPRVTHIVLIGCGTSLYSCMTAMYFFRRCVPNAHVTTSDAAEFDVHTLRQTDTTVIIVCSQSGETMDIIKTIENIQRTKLSACIVGVVNAVNSQISQMVDCGVYLNVGREVSVASTKSYVSSLLVFFLIAEWMHQVITSHTTSLDSVKKLITQVKMQTTQHIAGMPCDAIYKKYRLASINKPSLFILGRGRFEPVARECALKFKEVCYIHAEGYNAASLKHGPFALLTKDFPVILFLDRENRTKMLNTYQELVSREAHVMIVTDLNYHDELECEHVVYVPHNESLPEVLFANMMQMFAYCIAVENGYNPDRPRNLAKVVTVE
jgi:glucosamine--fructose-6-phosphate aminotransferase (isomerizing)